MKIKKVEGDKKKDIISKVNTFLMFKIIEKIDTEKDRKILDFITQLIRGERDCDVYVESEPHSTAKTKIF